MKWMLIGLLAIILLVYENNSNQVWLKHEELPITTIEAAGKVEIRLHNWPHYAGDIWFRRIKYYLCCVEHMWKPMINKSYIEITAFYKENFHTVEFCEYAFMGYNFAGNYGNWGVHFVCERYQSLMLVWMLPKCDCGTWLILNTYWSISRRVAFVQEIDLDLKKFRQLTCEDSWNYFYGKFFCPTYWFGNLCLIYCSDDDLGEGIHSTCDKETGNNVCEKGWTGTEVRYIYRYKTLHKDTFEGPVWRTHSIFSCDVLNLCDLNVCGKQECYQYRRTKYFCNNWFKPDLMQTRKYFYRGNYISCKLVSLNKSIDLSDLPLGVEIKPPAIVIPFKSKLEIGLIHASPGKHKVKCEIASFKENFTSTHEIEVITYLTPCSFVNISQKLCHYLYYEEVLTLKHNNTVYVPEMYLRFASRSGSVGAYIFGKKVWFTSNSAAGIYTLTCVLQRPNIDKSHTVSTDFAIHLLGETNGIFDPEPFEMSMEDTFNCMNDTDFGRMSTSARIEVIEEMPSMTIIKDSVTFQTYSQGQALIRCVFDSKMGKLTSRHKLFVKSTRRNLTISPTIVHADTILFCDVDGPIATSSYQYFWEIRSLAGVVVKVLETRRLNLALSGVPMSIGGNVTLACKMRIFVNKRITIIEQKLSTDILASHKPFMLHFPGATKESSQKKGILIFSICTPILKLLFLFLFMHIFGQHPKNALMFNWRTGIRLATLIQYSRLPPPVYQKRSATPKKKKKKKKKSSSSAV